MLLCLKSLTQAVNRIIVISYFPFIDGLLTAKAAAKANGN